MGTQTARLVRLGKAAVRVADDQPTFWDRAEAGTWEPATFAALDRFVRPGTVLVDLGAWVGPVSLYGAALGARVVAVEADPRALDGLCRNLAVNPDLAARVTVVPRAVSPTPAPVCLGARRKPGDSMSSVLLAGNEGAWWCEAITPSGLAAALGDPARLVVKIDIEGGEYALLPHLGPLLAQREVAVLLSLHPDILRESGVEDIEAETARALGAVFRAGLNAVEVARDEWLFVRGCPAADTAAFRSRPP